MTIGYTAVQDEKGRSLTVSFSDGLLLTIPGVHPRYDAVLEALIAGETDEGKIRDLTNLVAAAAARLVTLSERVRVAGSRLLFDGDEINDSIAGHILRLLDEGDEDGYKPLVAFLEKVATNPSEASREALYEWIADRDLTITETGDFIAYKGVKLVDGVSHSISAGGATVNGEYVSGYVPNPDGAVVEMPRSAVNDQRGVACSTGLHAGTWEYASDFAQGRVLTVSINPRDVVMVPSDCNSQKLRVCRYTVITSTEAALTTTTYYEDTESEDDLVWEDDNDDDECDCEYCVEDRNS